MPSIILVHGPIDPRTKFMVRLWNGPVRIDRDAHRIEVPFDDNHIDNLRKITPPTSYDPIIALDYDPATVSRDQLFAAIDAASRVAETHVVIDSLDDIPDGLLDRVDAFRGDPNRPDDLQYLQQWAPAVAYNPAKIS